MSGTVAHLLLESALRGSALLLIAAGASLALRRSSAAVRHMVWTIGIVGALAVAPLSHLLPAWPMAVPGAKQGAAAFFAPGENASVPFSPSAAPAPTLPPARSSEAGPAEWFGLIWLAGAAALGFSFLSAAVRLTRILRTAAPVENAAIERLAGEVARDLGVPRSRFRLRCAIRSLTPMTWGFWRPVVLLPAACLAWEEDRLRPVLVHEIAHVSRGDVLTQALSSLACVLYWFNPLVWWAARQMLIERERACDDRVLRSGAKASTYAQELLEMARGLGARWTAARVSPAMARRSQVSERLLAVLDPALPRYGAPRLAVWAGAVAGLTLLVPLAAVVPVPGAAATAAAAPVRVGRVAPADLEEAGLAVTAGENAMRAAIRRGDAAAMAAVYAEDAIAVAPDVLPMRGRRAIQDGAQHMLEQGVTDIEFQRAELFQVGDKVCERGRVRFSRSGGAEVSLQFMTLWKREAGEWRILRDYATP